MTLYGGIDLHSNNSVVAVVDAPCVRLVVCAAAVRLGLAGS